VEEVARHIDHFRFRDALSSAMNVARAGNKYLSDSEPWKLEKTDPERTRTILANSLNVAAVLSIVLEPFLPFTVEEACAACSASARCLGPRPSAVT
jgi:methionyl-tRNA synthetase